MKPNVERDMIGSVINGYEFLEHIGCGGSADVYKVRSLKFGVIFVAKILKMKKKNTQNQQSSPQSFQQDLPQNWPYKQIGTCNQRNDETDMFTDSNENKQKRERGSVRNILSNNHIYLNVNSFSSNNIDSNLFIHDYNNVQLNNAKNGNNEMDAWTLFDQEVCTLMKLDHPNIIRLYDRFKVQDSFFIILEFCGGGTLLDEINNNKGPLKEKRFDVICQQLISAVRYAHDNNVTHRDIKPENVFIDDFGRVKLADFGISQQIMFINENDTNDRILSNNKVCSIAYAPPELFKNIPHDEKLCDYWSLGITLIHCLTGSLPFGGRSKEEAIKIISSGMVAYPTKCSNATRKLLKGLTAYLPSDRKIDYPIIGRDLSSTIISMDGSYNKISSNGVIAENSNAIPKNDGSITASMSNIDKVILSEKTSKKSSTLMKMARFSTFKVNVAKNYPHSTTLVCSSRMKRRESDFSTPKAFF